MNICLRIAATLGMGLLIGLTACAPSSPSPLQPAQPAGALVKSDKQQVASPQVSPADARALVDGNNAFAFDLYGALKDDGGNLFYSPYSISLALAMTYAGAQGTTASQMADTLHYTLPQTSLHPAFNSLDSQLSKRGQGARGKDGKGFRLNIVNAIWGQKGYEFLTSFLDTLADNYGAGLRILDFAAAPEPARLTINKWVTDQTEGRIEDLIPQGVIDIYTRLVLTNAIYFNAAWQYPFEKGATAQGPFHLLDGSQLNVPLMHQTESLRYIEGKDYQAVELPYDGRETSMLILLPRTGQFTAFEKTLDAKQVASIVNALETRRVELTLPRFEFTRDFSLKKTLSTLGMQDAFSGKADFSGMTGKRDLQISDVIHKAFVGVDESGTEAAAATAVVMRETAMPAGDVIEVTIDRPFIFLIRDNSTGTVLFIGRVLDPGA
jgi:serpin B